MVPFVIFVSTMTARSGLSGLRSLATCGAALQSGGFSAFTECISQLPGFSLSDIFTAFNETFAPFRDVITQLLALQLEIAVDEIDLLDEAALTKMASTFQAKMNAAPMAKSSMMVIKDFFSGLLPSYSQSS